MRYSIAICAMVAAINTALAGQSSLTDTSKSPRVLLHCIPMTDVKWTDGFWADRHELYNMGHLLTAACIHHRATGKRNFLGVAEKLADYLSRQWKSNPPRLVHFPWNPSAHMGLIDPSCSMRNTY